MSSFRPLPAARLSATYLRIWPCGVGLTPTTSGAFSSAGALPQPARAVAATRTAGITTPSFITGFLVSKRSDSHAAAAVHEPRHHVEQELEKHGQQPDQDHGRPHDPVVVALVAVTDREVTEPAAADNARDGGEADEGDRGDA